MRQQSRIERRWDDVLRPKARPPPMERGRHLVGHFLTRKIGKSLSRRDFHRLVDRRGLNIERAPEDERETQDVVDLVGIVRPAGRHDRIVADGGDVLRRDLGIGVCHREDDRPLGHRRDHLTGHDAAR